MMKRIVFALAVFAGCVGIPFTGIEEPVFVECDDVRIVITFDTTAARALTTDSIQINDCTGTGPRVTVG